MHNRKDIDDIAYDILKRSKSLDVYPTPVDHIVQFCELNLGNSDYFHRIPKNYLAKNFDVFNRMLSKVFGVLDREAKHIYIDPTLLNVKQSFLKLHETGHHCLPWQRHVCYFDNEFTLAPEVQDTFEAEANYFASSALFQGERFDVEIKKLPLEIGSPLALAKRFGGSNHASIRRYVEHNKKRCALIVLDTKAEANGLIPLRNYFQSKSFAANFGNFSLPETFGIESPFIKDYKRNRRLHKNGNMQIETEEGVTEFDYHYFFNHHNAFVLILPIGEKNKSRTEIHIISQKD
jgi:hypothetical protein